MIGNLSAQSMPYPFEEKSSSKMKARAKNALKEGDTYTALFYYQELERRHPKDVEVHFQLAELYRFARNYKEAEKQYGIVYELNPKVHPYALYKKGIMQKMNGKPIPAKKSLLQFKKETKGLGDKHFKKHLKKELQGCDSAQAFTDFPERVVVNNMGNEINQPHADFSPFALDSTTLIFGSLISDTIKFYDDSFEHKDPKPRRQLFIAEKKGSHWTNQGLYEDINDPLIDMGKTVYNHHTHHYFFTKCKKNNKGKVICEVYMAQEKKGEIQKAELLPFPINMEGYTSTQPAVSYDTTKHVEKLYFVSDRPKGKGGLDIWYVSYNKRRKTWSKPRNAGGRINTHDTECTPYIDDATNTLYFSSDGHASVGGLDVFKSQVVDGKRLPSVNMGMPINSPQDDLEYTLNLNGKSGFLVSNRKGGTPYLHETCCDDIYAFNNLPPIPFKVDLSIAVAGKDSTECPTDELTMEVVDIKTNQTRTEVIKLKDCQFEFPLEKNKKYVFIADKEGFKPDTMVIETTKSPANNKISRTLNLEPLEEEKHEIPTEIPTEDKPFVLKEFHYESNQTTLSDEAKEALDIVLVAYLNNHPDIKIQIASHTDDVGSKKYNEVLSQQRAENVMKYVISKGISPDRLVAKGYGESKPIAPNNTQVGRSLNRRTEFSAF